MDTEILGLIEAYHQVYEELEEVGEEMKPLPKEKMGRQADKAYGKEVRAAAAGDEKETNKQMKRRIAMQSPASRRTELQNKKMAEELDIFDEVLEFLCVEGYAETLEDAEWMMANILDEEAIDIILGEEQLDEAEGSYGKTPKATSAYAALARSRSGRGSGKKLASKHAERSQKTAPGHSGKRSSSPYHTSGDREKMTQSDRDHARGRDEYGHTGYDPDYDGPASGPGGKPKGKKLERQRKTGVSAESFDYVNEASVANRDPEKYEAGQAKKSAPVRGEKTPMPPRGDKRREDFEKWYAANVR